MKIKVLGIGNTMLKDDGAGIYALRKLKEEVSHPNIEYDEEMVAGFNLLDSVENKNVLIFLDTITTKDGTPGDCYLLHKEVFSNTLHSNCVHQVDFFTAFELGKKMGMKMPDEIHIIAIEAKDIYEFGEECCEEVNRGIERAVVMAKEVLSNYLD